MKKFKNIIMLLGISIGLISQVNNSLTLALSQEDLKSFLTKPEFVDSDLTLNDLFKNLQVDDTAKLNVSSKFDIKFKSYKPDIVKVDKDGVVSARSTGACLIEVSIGEGSITRYIPIVVTEKGKTPSVEQVSEPILEVIDNKGTKASITTLSLPRDSKKQVVSNHDMYWMSTNKGIANISDDGIIEALKLGDTSIIGLSKDGSVISTLDLSVVAKGVSNSELKSLRIKELGHSMRIGESYQLHTAVEPENFKPKVVWKSHTSNASISDSGVLTILDKGDIKVTATAYSNEKEFIATFEGKSIYNTDSFSLVDNVIKVKSKDKITIKFDNELDPASVQGNVRLCKDVAGNQAIGDLKIHVKSNELSISNPSGWGKSDNNELYLCVDKGLKSKKGEVFGNRIKYKVIIER